jgi:hypothetical protein
LLLGALGTPAIDGPYAWEIVAPSDPGNLYLPRRLLHVVADRAHWQAVLIEAIRRAQYGGGEFPATGQAA